MFHPECSGQCEVVYRGKKSDPGKEAKTIGSSSSVDRLCTRLSLFRDKNRGMSKVIYYQGEELGGHKDS